MVCFIDHIVRFVAGSIAGRHIATEPSAVLSPHMAKRIVLTLPDGALTTVSGAGHAVMTDNPEGFSHAAGKFL